MSTSNTTDVPDTAAKTDDTRNSVNGWFATLRARLGLGEGPSLREALEDTLKQDSENEASFSPEERQMLLRLLHFGGSRVEDIMVPRADIIAIDEDAPASELLSVFEDAGVSRLPLYRDTLDDPRGMVHVKDLFSWLMSQAQNGNGHENGSAANPEKLEIAKPDSASSKTNGSARSVANEKSGNPEFANIDLARPVSMLRIKRQVLYVPPSMPAMNLLIKMQSTRIHMALVVDEYGGTDGLVTIEDLVEQIVGDIEDEHDEAEAAHITEDAKLGLVASARTPVAELEERLNRKLLTEAEEEDIDTLGGLVFTIVGRIPARGELVRHHSGLEFEVLDADPRRVKKLKIHGLTAAKRDLNPGGTDATQA
ncbi:MAG: hemolysin family protein [Filomicrobium sp.]